MSKYNETHFFVMKHRHSNNESKETQTNVEQSNKINICAMNHEVGISLIKL